MYVLARMYVLVNHDAGGSLTSHIRSGRARCRCVSFRGGTEGHPLRMPGSECMGERVIYLIVAFRSCYVWIFQQWAYGEK